MRVVVDTNVLASAVLKDKDPETVLLFIIESPDTEALKATALRLEFKNIEGMDITQTPS